MNQIEITFNAFDKEHKARFWKSNYANNGNLYVGIMTWNEVDECWESWSDLTVNLGITCLPGTAFIDTNNCSGEIITTLADKGYIQNTGFAMPSGFCMYPMVEFSEEFLNGMIEQN